MSQLNKGKHIIEEFDGVRCTLVEKNISQGRVDFLKDLLEFNKYPVMVKEEVSAEGEDKLFSIAVNDILFNPIIAVYERAFKTKDGKIVTPAYWNQYTDKINYQYWRFTKDRETKEYTY